MKKQIYIIIMLLLVVASSCKKEEYTIQDSYALYGATSVSGAENGGPIAIPLIIGSPGGSGTTVNFEFSTEGFDNAAQEGVDFTLLNASKSITVSAASALDTIWIQPVDNDVFGGNKSFNVILTSATNGYLVGDLDTCAVSIVDNEHPLAQWIGSYTVDAYSNRNPGAWDEVWNVTTSPNPLDVNQLFMTGIAGSSSVIVATLDLNNNTITVATGQNAAGGYGYDNVGIFNFDGANVTTDPIVGTISADGTIAFDFWVHVLTDYGNYVWDIFTPTFNKN